MSSDITSASKPTAKDILSLLRERYQDSREWVIASEVQRTTGWSDRRYDFVAMNCFASNGFKIEVVEIKVSKSDLRRELESPEKHNIIFDDIDYYSLAAPADIIEMSIIPPKWGIYAVKDGKLITKRKPLALHDERQSKVSRSFVASFMRASAAQNLDRGLIGTERAKAFQEGYDTAKKEIGQMADSWDEYKRIRAQNIRYRDWFSELGIYGDPGDGRGKEKWEKTKQWVKAMRTLDLEELLFHVQESGNQLKKLEESIGIVESIQKKVLGETEPENPGQAI